MKQRKQYENLVIETLDCPLERAVLSESPSEVYIDPDNVGVDPYGNGFLGDPSAPDGFGNITFD